AGAERGRARRAVAHRSLHRRAAARARDLRPAAAGRPAPQEAQEVSFEEGGVGMSAVAETVVSDEVRQVTVRSWKTPIIFAVFTVLFALLPIAAPHEGESTFSLVRGANAAIQVPDLVLPTAATVWLCVVLLAAGTALATMRVRARRDIPLWLVTVYVIVLLVGFLTWAAAGATLPMIGLLGGALTLATPLIFGALGGVIGERVGVVNIAIEAQLLAGAFTAALIGTMTGTPWLGLVAAMIAGLLVGLVLAVFA